jgi:hypothetical protein
MIVSQQTGVLVDTLRKAVKDGRLPTSNNDHPLGEEVLESVEAAVSAVAGGGVGALGSCLQHRRDLSQAPSKKPL